MKANIDWTLIYNIFEIIGAVFIGALITYITTFSKLKKEQRAIILGKTMEDRRKALIEIKNIISELSIFERADVAHPESAFDKPFLYHAVFEDNETFEKFHTKISYLRKEYDQYIDGKIFLALVFIEKYLFEFKKAIHIGLQNEEGAVYTIGVAAYEEVNKWYKKTLWIVDKELNKPRYKYRKKYGFLYNRRLNKIVKKLKKTQLYNMFIVEMNLEDENIGKKFKDSVQSSEKT